jgi:tetratricopeptide (TPR) repeat protein
MITPLLLGLLLWQDDPMAAGKKKFGERDLEGAAACFAKAAEADGRNAAAWTALSDAQYRLGDFEKAETFAAKAVEIEPTAARHALLGFARHRRAKLTEADKSFDAALKLDETCAAAHVGKAEIALAANDVEACDAALAQALKLDGKNAEGLYLRGILKNARGNPRGMMRDLDRAIEADPLHLDSRLMKVTALADGGDPAGALKEFEELLKIRPKSDTLFGLRGTIKSRANDAEGALADFAKAIELRPENPENWLRRAEFFRGGAQEQEKAIADYTKVLELSPEHNRALTGRGYAYCRVKNFKAAGKDMARAYEVRTEDPWGAYNLACFHGLRAKELEGEEKKAAIEKAFDWLKEARKGGYGKLACGCHGSNLKHLRTDSDLDPLHDDPRWKQVSADEAD